MNFWQPSAQNFNAISTGEIFAFRLKSPRNKIGGFGILSNATLLPIQLAWDTFGTGNGVPDAESLLNAIANYRHNETVTFNSFIVCRVIVEPIFFPESLWFELPASWASSIQKGKTYSTDTDEGKQLWDSLTSQAALADRKTYDQSGFFEPAARFGKPQIVQPRLGQGAFRIAVIEAYGRQCALTEGKVLPALDSAHIQPYSAGGVHLVQNGILLRKDIHSVFDAGYATIDKDYRFVVSDKIKEIFDNGNEYRRLHGKTIRPPRNATLLPSERFLDWHNTKKFVG